MLAKLEIHMQENEIRSILTIYKNQLKSSNCMTWDYEVAERKCIGSTPAHRCRWQLLLSFLLNKGFLFFFFFERQSYRQKEKLRKKQREDHSPRGCKSWSWTDLKPRARSLFWVSHVGAGAKGLEPPSTAFSGCKQGVGSEVNQLGHMSTWEASTTSRA